MCEHVLGVEEMMGSHKGQDMQDVFIHIIIDHNFQSMVKYGQFYFLLHVMYTFLTPNF